MAVGTEDKVTFSNYIWRDLRQRIGREKEARRHPTPSQKRKMEDNGTLEVRSITDILEDALGDWLNEYGVAK